MSAGDRLVDLSHPLEEGMAPYPGLPPPRFRPIISHDESRDRYEGKAEFLLGGFEMPGNLGTYVDAPFHRFRDRDDLSKLPLEALAGLRGVVVDADASAGPVDLDLDRHDLEGAAVLIRTGWSERWGTDAYWEPGPFVAADDAATLVERRPAFVGVDFWNIDDTTDAARPAHTRLLGAGILIVEHLTNLAALPPSGFRFFAVPPMIVGGASFPVRAFAEVRG